MMTIARLCELHSIPLESTNINDLIEIDAITVDRQLAKELRIMKFIEETKNPYCFRIGNNVIKTQFSDSGLTIQSALAKFADR